MASALFPLPPSAAASFAMVVANETEERHHMAHSLGQLGFSGVWQAPSGREALARMAQAANGPQLIVSALHMPDMDGIELLQHLKDMGYRGALGLVCEESGIVVDVARCIAESAAMRWMGRLGPGSTLPQWQQLLSGVQREVAPAPHMLSQVTTRPRSPLPA